MEVLVTQLCLTLCNPMDSSMPGFSVHWILQARILEWVVIPSPKDLPQPVMKPGALYIVFSSLPGLYLLDAGNILLTIWDNQTYFRMLPYVPLGTKLAPLKNL